MQNKTNNKKNNIIKDKNHLNHIKHIVGQLSTSVLDLLKVFYNTRSGNKILEYSAQTLKIRKSNKTNIITINETQQTSKPHTKKVNENIQPTTEEYKLFIPVTENQKNYKKLYNKKK